MEFWNTLEIVKKISQQYMIDTPYTVGGLPRDIYLSGKDVKTPDVDLTTNSSEVLRLAILVSDNFNVPFELSDDGHTTVFTDYFDLDFSSNFISDKVSSYLGTDHKKFHEAFSRDFTINTLHQDLVTREFFDPTGMAIKDLDSKIIRTPVPAEITLTDDPRRIYRAVNLAARYDFKIDDEIKNFVIDNPEIFIGSSVKDKYITVKINKALKENELLTIKLLKEMNLFKNIPLSGHFKEVLIRNKLLSEYLESNALDHKTASIANSWSQYESRGEDHQKLSDWWHSNYYKIPGITSSSYHSWASWYMQNMNSVWGVHKSPLETLEVMKNLIDNPTEIIEPPISGNFEKRRKKLLNLISPDGNIHLEPDEDLSKVQPKFLNIVIKPGVNIENVTPDVKAFIREVAFKASEMGVKTPVITSGWRSLKSQATIMAKNWKSNGGKDSGRRYLTWLYGNKFGGDISYIFENYGTEPRAISMAIEIIKSRPVGSHHITNPGQAVDFAITNGIKHLLDTVNAEGKFDIKIVDESKTAGPHYHVTVLGMRTFASSAIDRRARILKISTTNND